MASIIGIIILLMILGGFAGLIVLQVKLSRKEAAMPGLILPIISFVFALFIALVFVLNMAVTDAGGTVETVSGSEVIIEEIQVEASEKSADAGFAFLPVLAMNAIPCIVYLLIYFACHPSKKKRAKRAELDKMSINDL